MLSKNFIFTALFFGVVVLCLSCFENKAKYKELYTISPTDSSSFTISLEGMETIKSITYSLDGKWKLIQKDSLSNSAPLYLFFDGRKIYSNLKSDFDFFNRNNEKDKYQVFAPYNKCLDEGGSYNKKGNFLVIGSGDEQLICYKVISFEENKLILYDMEKGGELEFRKIN